MEAWNDGFTERNPGIQEIKNKIPKLAQFNKCLNKDTFHRDSGDSTQIKSLHSYLRT